MTFINPWLWLIPAAGLMVLIAVWRFHGLGHVIMAERARESFRLQRERLETLFLEEASKGGTPRGLRWLACAFSDEVEFGKERQSGQIVALVGATIQFEAIAGSDMEGLPAVPLPRQGTAVLNFTRGHWLSVGKVIFNLRPSEVLDRFAAAYEPLPRARKC